MNVLELSEQEIVRRNNLNELRALGIDPYPADEYPTDAFSTDIKAEYDDAAEEKRQVCIAGRIMSRRIMGKASFLELQDSKGRIQVYVTRDDICPGENKDLYNTVFKKLLDLGDFVGIKGFVFKTQTGEISVHTQELTVLAKSLKPLPIVKMKDGEVFRRPGTALPPTLRGLDCQQRSEGNVPEAFGHPENVACRPGRSRLHGGGDAHPAIHPGRSQRTPVHYPPQLARHRPVSSYRHGTLPETPHRRRV